jgi:hypothetical protein
METVFESVLSLGRRGSSAKGPFGKTYRIFPFLFAYCVDYVERVLVCCVKHQRCAECLVTPKNMGLLSRGDYWVNRYGKRTKADFENPDALSKETKKRKRFLEDFGLHLTPRIWYENIETAVKDDLFGGIFFNLNH